MSTIAATNLKNPSSGSNNIVLAADGSTTIGNRVGKSSYAIIADQKAQNTDGGTFTLGAWRIRDLNTEIADPDGIVSISSNQFTLQAGSYLIRWSAPAFKAGNHQTRLYNVTAATVAGIGDVNYSGAANYASNTSRGATRVVIASSTAFELQHQCNLSSATTGLGWAANFTTEQYAIVEIVKES